MGRLTFGAVAALAAALCAGCITATGQSRSATVSAGEPAWAKCLACHALTPGADDRDGPTLHRIVGRKVAALPDYRYSPAMRSYARRQPRWTREALDAFLAEPQALVPDNAMGFFGMSDPAERAALIAWLARPPRSADQPLVRQFRTARRNWLNHRCRSSSVVKP